MREPAVIGVYDICNTGSVLGHQIEGGKVLASFNGKDPEWCDITEEYNGSGEESGFYLDSFFVPLAEVMRV